jgi:GT2 family glycosyltransferase
MTVRCVDQAINAANFPLELLCIDNGSTDRRVIDYIAGLPQKRFHAQSPVNVGIAKGINRLLDKAVGDYLCIVDNDILLPDNWLANLVKASDTVPDSGLIGIPWNLDQSAYQENKTFDGILIHPHWAVNGTKFFKRAVFEKIGFMCEEYGVYGNEESDYNYRAGLAGFYNFYIDAKSSHLGNDIGEETPYRKMKWESLWKGGPLLGQNLEKYRTTGQYYIPRPL